MQNKLVKDREPMRENRPYPESAQHAKDSSEIRGVQRHRQEQSEQATEEAPEMYRRRKRAPQVPRNHSLVRSRGKRVHEPLLVGEVLRLPDNKKRVLGETGDE